MDHQWYFLWVHSVGGVRSCNIRPPHPNDLVGIDLTPTHIPEANLRINTRKKMTIYVILLQPIRAKLFWWLLNYFFKIRRPVYSCFSVAMTSLFGYLFTPLCISSFFLLPPLFFSNLPKKKINKKNFVHKHKIAIKTTNSYIKLTYV